MNAHPECNNLCTSRVSVLQYYCIMWMNARLMWQNFFDLLFNVYRSLIASSFRTMSLTSIHLRLTTYRDLAPDILPIVHAPNNSNSSVFLRERFTAGDSSLSRSYLPYYLEASFVQESVSVSRCIGKTRFRATHQVGSASMRL